MTISEKVEQIISQENEKQDNKTRMELFRDLQTQMEKIGFTQRQEYTLPPLDTIGRKVFEVTNARTPKY